jgi:hypothetical protein
MLIASQINPRTERKLEAFKYLKGVNPAGMALMIG